MDVQLAGKMNGIEAAVAIRREFPRLPVVFYSIQDDDAYYRAFRRSGILSHYAYVRKSNYLLPQMIVPLLRDAVAGRSFIDPEIESRVQEVREKDEQSPMALLEPNEQAVARMLARGMSITMTAPTAGKKTARLSAHSDHSIELIPSAKPLSTAAGRTTPPRGPASRRRTANDPSGSVARHRRLRRCRRQFR